LVEGLVTVRTGGTGVGIAGADAEGSIEKCPQKLLARPLVSGGGVHNTFDGRDTARIDVPVAHQTPIVGYPGVEEGSGGIRPNEGSGLF